LHHNDDLFLFTRGRFVCNEAYEMSQRHIRFNVNELARLAAEAVGSKSCVAIEKYPDGMFNKALLLTMEDGTQVVAKIPNPNAGLPHFTIASEVATMEFVCITVAFCKMTALTFRRHGTFCGLPFQRSMHGVPGQKRVRLVPSISSWRSFQASHWISRGQA
jgi:hypothetical protein